MTGLSVLIPAHNEAALIGACLSALLASDPVPGPVEVIVIANGCRDDTAARAKAHGAAVAARGWALQVLDLPEGGKTGALNAGDAAAQYGARLYLDADVTMTPALLGQIMEALDTEAPRYASGTLTIARAARAVSRAYARIWAEVPFMREGVPGAGLFAVNAAGRARWDAWPGIISDDTYARLLFAPEERRRVPARYDWPVVEGWRALVRVRRRQDQGVREIAERFPALLTHQDSRPLGKGALLRLALRDPVGVAAYTSVALATRLSKSKESWARGR